MADEIPLPIKDAEIGVTAGPGSDATHNFTEEKYGQKGEANNKLSSVLITIPFPDHLSKANQEAKA